MPEPLIPAPVEVVPAATFSPLNLLDKEAGRKIRAALAVLVSLATMVMLVLQTIVDNIGLVPSGGPAFVYSALGTLPGVVIAIGRFTKIGNKLS